ncbi:MAG: hypothetical protein AABZ57_03995 [Candidatus Margulisiibacteriota bacterium]
MKYYLACLISAGVLFSMTLISGVSLAGNQAAGAKKEKYITKGEMATMLSATDYMKKKISDLFNVAVGYNLVQLNRATMAPIIKYVKVSPSKVPADGVSLFDLIVAVEDPSGLTDIKDVRADALSIGRLSNMKLVDNGLWGDQKRSDGIFTLQSSVNAKTSPGDKEILIAVANKKGWLSLAKANITVDPSAAGASQ